MGTEAVRQAEEIILEDERLTADLEDAEASVLLRWAISAARQAAGVGLEGGAGREAIAEAVQPVRRVARAINDLVSSYCDMAPGEFLSQLLALVELARRLPPAEAAPSADSGDNPARQAPPSCF